ncbi:hypothetical protein N7462_006406 [Penicillium macrosclerotiorum]|uniref:uncharacterized protein n=1 Tax=Penicillium macrosclerotiorum TaxID=303699 RepID=UPI0025481D6C|nr:uncharacterized protein N7462_006406 [Penicillium macrosclerotiorum]KAJ5683241.1 hypothetical protein N7462_006406 [Penicillium macrosclerotiorum]
MVALGSLFVCEKGAVEKGEMLWRLGHMAVATSWQTLIGMRGPYDACDGIQLVLTALLGQTYALLSSSASVRTTASVFHGLGFYWARNSGMYMIQDILADGIPTLDMPEADKNTVWRKWAATEVQRRVILGHYILDGLISQASGSPASARHLINSIDTACSDTVFAAKTADAWILETTRSSRVQMPMSEAFYRVCSPGYSTNPTYLSQFSIFVIIEGLQSLIADLHEVRGHVFGTVSRQEVVRAMLNIFQGNIITMSQPRSVHHLHLLIRWHCIFIEATAPSISIYRWMCNRYQLPQTLGGIHAKSRLEQFDVNHWAEKADAFRAVLHAISITRLLDDLPLNQAYTMHIPTAVFTSAMVIVTMCLLKQSIIEIPENYTWTDVWASQLDDEHESLDHGLALEELMRKLNPDDKVPMVPIHLLDEINSLQHILKTVASRWGVSAQMEDLISRLAVIARERRATSF